MPAFPGWERRKVYANNNLAESVLNFEETIASAPIADNGTWVPSCV